MGWFDKASTSSESDNPGGNPNFDAGVQEAQNDAEAQAARDYDSSVGSDSHQQEVSDARESSGFSEHHLARTDSPPISAMTRVIPLHSTGFFLIIFQNIDL